MLPTSHLKQAFSRNWPRIQKARKTDGRLDEICTDFETLSLELENAGKEPYSMSNELKADFARSIEALTDEISNRLILEKNEQ